LKDLTKVMIPKECKRLAEVDFPIAVVSKHSAREKSIRHGHPSTLHLWWARRPLAACRAMLLALLLPDPCDSHCPEDFKTKARTLLPQVTGGIGPNDSDLRKTLLKFIGDFSNWDLSSNQTYLEVGRGLVKAAHPEETPLVVDPFAGGGSIPLEALRLGCEAFASDLNPVACLILKVMLEDIPRHGPELADELRRAGKEIKEAAEKELKEFYPDDPDGAKPIAYLWARTVSCESPNCGAEIPLVRSFWLCKKTNRKRALKYKVIAPSSSPSPTEGDGRFSEPRVEFEIFEPTNDNDVPPGAVARARATCLCCGIVLSPERVRAQLAAQRGGADAVFDQKGNRIGGSRLLTVVTLGHNEQGRHYRLPTPSDYEAPQKAQKLLQEIIQEWEQGGKQGLCPIPDEPLPPIGTLGFRVQRYGMLRWGDLFTARQKVALANISQTVRDIELSAYSEIAALVFSKYVELLTANSLWEPVAECPRKIFNMQALPMQWEFAESVVTSSSSGSIETAVYNFERTLQAIGSNWGIGQSQLADACNSVIPERSSAVCFTDPPYYDAVPYADLSDFFFVWLKRMLRGHVLLKDPFDPQNVLTPKVNEIVQDETKQFNGKAKDRDFFEERMTGAFWEAKNALHDDGVGCIVFAHKTTEGWEALLSGMLRTGWTITASWPITTEQEHRPRARESAALAASIHLICRPRPEDASVGDWGDVLRELPTRVRDWMERLQLEGIRGADLVFACIGPALEIFSRYSKVVDAEEREIPLGGDPEASEPHKRGFLAYVWEVVGRMALEQVLGTAEAKVRNGSAGAIEEDARLTALFLWTLQSTNGNGAKDGDEELEDEDTDEEEEEAPKKRKQGYSLIFDVARRFAQPLGIHLPDWEGRIIETQKGIVRLLPVKERAKQLFGEEGAHVAAERIERSPVGPIQLMLFHEETRGAVPEIKGRSGKGKKRVAGEVSDEALRARREATTLDRVHAAMLLQAGGRANALRALLKAEQDRGPEFLRLANALSALYPKNSEEKRLLDAMLLALPR
jgi:putative DNA methylase